MKVLIIDNYDSFVYNLAQYVGELGAQPIVIRNDKVSLADARRLNPDRIMISPGPGTPEDERYFGVCKRVLEELSTGSASETKGSDTPSELKSQERRG